MRFKLLDEIDERELIIIEDSNVLVIYSPAVTGRVFRVLAIVNGVGCKVIPLKLLTRLKPIPF